jgi:hypothetical protein
MVFDLCRVILQKYEINQYGWWLTELKITLTGWTDQEMPDQVGHDAVKPGMTGIKKYRKTCWDFLQGGAP